MTDGRSTLELRRRSVDLVYTLDRSIRGEGAPAWKRRGGDLWIVRREGCGWVAWDDAGAACLGRRWNVLPRDEDGAHLPAGGWVGRNGGQSYVWRLVPVS